MIRINYYPKSTKSIGLLICIVLLVSCGGIRPSATGSNPSSQYQKGIVAFFVNDSVEQFFVKPISFKNKSNSLTLESDFNIRTGDGSDFVDAKLSIFSKEKLAFDEFGEFYFGGALLKDVNLMYANKHKKNKFEIRVSGRLEKSEFASLPEDAVWKIDFQQNDLLFIPQKSSKKVMQNFSENWIK